MDNLSREMIQCKKDGFGCHYGRWKAMQEPVKITPREEKHHCLYCGREVVRGEKGFPKYCDAYCGEQYRRIKYREKAAAEKEDSCGKLLALVHKL